MTPLTEALEELIALGVEGPALVAAMRRLEAATYGQKIKTLEEAVDAASSRADAEMMARKERQERDANRKRSKRVSADVRGNPETSAEIQAEPLSLPPSPQTPQPPTHTRVSITTREREDAAFGRFWQAYPRKVSKADARKAFTAAWRKLPEGDEEQILTGGLERAKAAWVDAQFIPHAATWLNGERWNDEPPPPTQIRQAHERNHPNPRQTAREDNLRAMHAGAMEALNRYRN